jgi:maltose-binding protein MalE
MKIVFAVLKRHWLALLSLALVVVLLALSQPAHLVFAAAVVLIVGLWAGEASTELALTRRHLAAANAKVAQERAATVAQQEKAERMLDAVFKAGLDTVDTGQPAALARLWELHKACQAIQYGVGSEPLPSVTQGEGSTLVGAQQ